MKIPFELPQNGTQFLSITFYKHTILTTNFTTLTPTFYTLLYVVSSMLGQYQFLKFMDEEYTYLALILKIPLALVDTWAFIPCHIYMYKQKWEQLMKEII